MALSDTCVLLSPRGFDVMNLGSWQHVLEPPKISIRTVPLGLVTEWLVPISNTFMMEVGAYINKCPKVENRE